MNLVNCNSQQEMMADFDSEMRKREHEFHLKLDEMNSVVLSHELKVRTIPHQTYYNLYVRRQGRLVQWLSTLNQIFIFIYILVENHRCTT